jgi:aspartyl aminopeptidase
MSKIYTITISDAEEKALQFVSVSAQEWIENVVHERCRIAIDEIVQIELERATLTGGSISGTKEEIVLASNAKSAAERRAEYDANVVAQAAGGQA